MKPLSWKNKVSYNYPDCHPKKGYVNWWEDMSHSGSKTANRMKAKLELKR